jgi:methyl-accepting chemotaxis protein
VLARFKKQVETTSLVSALDALRANVMITDDQLNITYLNSAAKALMQEAEADLRKELPRFSVATLIGSNIDVFHTNPSHQRTMLATLRAPHSATIKVGRWSFDVVVTPLVRRGQRRGFVVEWADASARLLNVDYANKMAAISRFQSVIEFTVDGVILDANKNFLDALGYTAAEVVAKTKQAAKVLVR